MIPVGDVVDGKYMVTGVCSDEGGMGTLLHVKRLYQSEPFPIVLKHCKLEPSIPSGCEGVKRFRREVRYLVSLNGNSKTVEIIDHNLAFDPPYFVMRFYPDGDLSNLGVRLRRETDLQERMLNEILDCIAELHSRGMYHRDIKPANFLLDGEHLIVSDFGLAKVADAGTTFTQTLGIWGTPGYMPPEYRNGGFREATPEVDVFMIGKTFYSLLSGRDDVLYLSQNGIPTALYHVINRCCQMNPLDRYHSIAELRQDLTLAYDVVLGRAGQIDKVRKTANVIVAELDAHNTFNVAQVEQLLDGAAMLDQTDRHEVYREWPESFYSVFSHPDLTGRTSRFLDLYHEFARTAVNSWSYAETVASNMNVLFRNHPDCGIKARALDIALDGAIRANRFAAMDICTAMIQSAQEKELAERVAGVLTGYPGSFIVHIELSGVKSDLVRNAIRAMNKSASGK